MHSIDKPNFHQVETNMRELDQRDVLNVSGGRPEVIDYDVMLADINQSEQDQGYLAEMFQLSRTIRTEFAW
jgi:hypothetical protein